MNRRSFIQFNSLVGFGVLSGIPDSFYTSIVKPWKLAGFEKEITAYFNEIATQIITNIDNETLGIKIATDLLSPVEIIEQESHQNMKRVTFKNIEGSFVQYSFQNGNHKISMVKSLPAKLR